MVQTVLVPTAKPSADEAGAVTARRERVLVVIPCLNEEAHVEEVVRFALAELEGRDGRVIVADGGSTDATAAIVARLSGEDPRVGLVNNPRRIQSAGINLAVAEHGGDHDILIRLDAHAGYAPGLVGRLLDIAREKDCESVVVPMKTEGFSCFQRAAAAAQNSPFGNGGSRHRTGGYSGWVDHGHHALIRLDAFRRIEGYDPVFSHNEDAEFDRRLTQSGGRIWLAGDCPIIYYPRRTPGALFRQYQRYGRGRCMTFMKHGMWPKLRQWIPILLLPGLVTTWLVPPFALAVLALWAGFCIVLGVQASLARRDRCLLFLGVAASLMQIGWSYGFWRTLLLESGRRSPLAKATS